MIKISGILVVATQFLHKEIFKREIKKKNNYHKKILCMLVHADKIDNMINNLHLKIILDSEKRNYTEKFKKPL